MVYKQAGGALSQFSLSLLCVRSLCLPKVVGVRFRSKTSSIAFVYPDFGPPFSNGHNGEENL